MNHLIFTETTAAKLLLMELEYAGALGLGGRDILQRLPIPSGAQVATIQWDPETNACVRVLRLRGKVKRGRYFERRRFEVVKGGRVYRSETRRPFDGAGTMREMLQDRIAPIVSRLMKSMVAA